jgi:endonuclease/exonuclease/phosphatase (EEP) superfamily protein YafD
VLAGDLNSAVSGAPVRALARRWRLSCGQEAAPTYPADAPQECIDHVLFRPADRWRVLACQVLAEPVASDHRPVLVELELRPGPVVWPG